MYPTPPSHENNNHVLSPMTNFEAPPDTTVTEGSGVCVKQESLLAEELAQVLGLNLDSTHLRLASILWDIGKQQSPRWDAAERGVPSGAFLFAWRNFIKK